MKRIILAVLIALCLPAPAQTPLSPINFPVFKALNKNAKPLVGGRLFSYAAGTTTPLATYTNATGATPNTNPVILDSAGTAKIFLSTATYKFVLQDQFGAVQWTVDNIVGSPSALTTNPSGSQTIPQPPGTSLTVNHLLTSNTPFKCAETYLSADTTHSGTDYGAAINAAIQASPLQSPTQIKLCAPGEHQVYTQIVFDRPINFEMPGSKLIPQSSMGSTPVSITGATVTADSETIALSSTAGLSVNQQVGGLGITSGSYITAMTPSSITVSLMPSLVVNGYVTSGSPVILISSSLAGIAVGQKLTGFGMPANASITAINLSEPQSITINGNATQTLNTSVALSVSAGSWTVPVLTAVTVTPVMVWKWNASPAVGANPALHNEFGQMIGGSMRDVWIKDNTLNGIKGLQGIQIYGWDGFNAYNTRVDFIAGSGLVLGGNVDPVTTGGDALGDVRESFFYDTKIRYSGDVDTSQPALSLISTFQRGITGGDELNEIGFIGGQLVTEYGESLTIGTYDPAHTGFGGPGNIFFNSNFQIEGSNYLAIGGYSSAVPAIATQFDLVHIIEAAQVFFSQGEIAVPGYGKAAVRIDTANLVSFDEVELYADGNSRNYTVELTNGSSTATWVASDDGNGFLVSHSMDGIAAATVISNSNPNCATPCVFHLSPTNAVPNSTTLNLSIPYKGTTNARQLIHMPTGGYIINIVNSIQGLYVQNGYMVPPLTESEVIALGGTSPRQMLYVGNPIPPGFQQNLQYFTSAPHVGVVYDAPTVTLGTYFAPELTTGHSTQRFFGNGPTTNSSGIEQFNNIGGPGSTLNSISWGLFRNRNVMMFDGTGTLAVPTINANKYQLGGTPGFTGTKTGAACIFTIQGGLITNVTGC
jgi:hypothetical protein